MEEKKKKSKLMIIIAIVVIIIVAVVGIVIFMNNKDNSNNNETSNISNNAIDKKSLKIKELIEKSETLDWINVFKTISNDSSKVADYNNKVFVYTGIVYQVNNSNNAVILTNDMENGKPSISNKNQINVFLDDVKDLKEFNVISIVGTLNITGNIYDFKDAFIIPSDFENDKYNIGLLKDSSGYYHNYKFDKATGKVVGYTVTQYGQTKYGDRHDSKNVYSLKYDNENLIEEKYISYQNDEEMAQTVKTYTYNEDNTLKNIEDISTGKKYTTGISKSSTSFTYEKNENGKIIKKIEQYNLNDSYTRTNITTYEYNEQNQVIKETVRNSGNTTEYIYTYEYNKDGSYKKKNDSLIYEYDKKGNAMNDKCYGIIGEK